MFFIQEHTILRPFFSMQWEYNILFYIVFRKLTLLGRQNNRIYFHRKTLQ